MLVRRRDTEVAVMAATDVVQVAGGRGRVTTPVSEVDPWVLVMVTLTLKGVPLFRVESTTTKDWPMVTKLIEGNVVVMYWTYRDMVCM